MILGGWRGNALLVVALYAAVALAAQENQAGLSTAPQPAAKTQPTTDQAQPTDQKGKHRDESCVPVPADETTSELSQKIDKEICLSAHVYDVVELADGTRFLDVCPADVPDERCRFTLVSLQADRAEVGDLRRYRDQNIRVRGTVRAMHGRMGMVISHMRQFSGGPEKFRPNPRLLKGFNGQSDRMPVHDPNLSSTGHHRSFMDTRKQESLPTARNP